MDTDDAVAIARRVMEIVPLVGRTMAAEMRQAVHGADPTNFRLLWLLSHRNCTLSELAERQSIDELLMREPVKLVNHLFLDQRDHRQPAPERQRPYLEKERPNIHEARWVCRRGGVRQRCD